MKAIIAFAVAMCILTVSLVNRLDNALDAGEPPKDEHRTVMLSCRKRMLPLPNSANIRGIVSNASVIKGILELAYVKTLITQLSYMEERVLKRMSAGESTCFLLPRGLPAVTAADALLADLG